MNLNTLMMMEQKELIKLPTEPYSVKSYARSYSKEITFNIQPLSSDCLFMIEKIQEMGATVRVVPEENPTSLFISYEKMVDPVETQDHQVVGALLDLNISLLDNETNRAHERLYKFLWHMIGLDQGKLPSGATGVKWVQVLNSYKL